MNTMSDHHSSGAARSGGPHGADAAPVSPESGAASAAGASGSTPVGAEPGREIPVLRIVGVLAARPVLILVLGLLVLAAGQTLLWTNALVVIVDLATFGVLALAMRAEGRSLLDLMRPWRWVDLAWGALMLVILLVGFLVSNVLANLIVYQGAPPAATGALPHIPVWAGIIALVIAPATIALAEEGVYRGYAQPRLARRTGRLLSIVLVAAVFGIQHLGFVLGDGQAIAAKILTTFFAGLLFGALMLWLKRIMPLVIGHWVLDLVMLGLPTLVLALA